MMTHTLARACQHLWHSADAATVGRLLTELGVTTSPERKCATHIPDTMRSDKLIYHASVLLRGKETKACVPG